MPPRRAVPRLWRQVLLLFGLLVVVGEPGESQSVDDQLEDEWYLPVASGCRLYVRELGDGTDTVVVLHGGFGADYSYLLPGFRRLFEDFHFVFYDQRGSLRSPCPDSNVSIDAHVQDLEQVRIELGLERMTLAAHSMGTFVAMTYLARYPDRVGKLALVGAVPPHTPTDAVDSGLVAASEKAFAAWVQRPEVTATKAREKLLATSGLSPKLSTRRWRIDFTAANAYHVDRWRHMVGGQVFYSGGAGRAAAQTMPASYDFRGLLASHPCGVTVIVGDHDLVDMGAERHRRWTAQAPSVELVVIPQAGHVPWIDAPDGFETALRRAVSPETSGCR